MKLTLIRFRILVVIHNIGANRNMSSLEKINDTETIRNMSINIAVIFGVVAALIIVSVYFAGT